VLDGSLRISRWLHVIEALTAEGAVLRERPDIEVDITVRRVGVAGM